MKKRIAFLLVGLLVVSLLGSCGGGKNAGADDGSENGSAARTAEAVPVDQIKTMGDVFTYESSQTAYSEENYIYVFEADGVTYRAEAELPPDVSAAIWGLDFSDEGRDAKVIELVSPLEVSRLDNLSEMIPTQEELDGWIGKTGQDLIDDGWTNSGYMLDTMEFYMSRSPFNYIVTFEYDGPQLENTDDFDWEETVKPLKIKSVTYDGIGDAMELD